MTDTIYLPPTADRPAEPAPYLMTDQEVARLLRLQCKGEAGVEEALRRMRDKGLKAVQVGLHLRYLLADVLDFLVYLRQVNDPRERR